MVIKSRAPRWYAYRDGVIQPMYELQKKDKSGMKAYTLREARELKLLPSVTSVLSVIDKPELDNWRVSQAIHSALTLPREKESYEDWTDRIIHPLAMREGGFTEGDLAYEAYSNPPRYLDQEDTFAERVLADAEAQATKAAEFGTRIHDAIADYLTDISKEPDPDLVPFLMPFADWALDNIEQVHSVERCVGSPVIGVAGRMDLDCTLKGVGRAVCDFKSQNIKDGKAKFWPDFGPQLAAYAMCCNDKQFGGEIARHLVSVVIPSNEPGPVAVKVYDGQEHFRCRRIFGHALELWIELRDYDPRQ